ncbi:hypothetical protein COT50_02495, partial [candidate division WWE3 bacterium CG08_land_8_20_14_0_20_41_10]
MQLHLPNSAFIGNIDAFLGSFDPSDSGKLEITANKKWISVHPVALSMTAALGLTVDSEDISCEPFEAKSRHYFERMGLFKLLGIASGIKVIEREPAGRFIPLTQIRNSVELTDFIAEMVPLLHLEPIQAEPLKYVVAELVRNVFEHSCSPFGAIICAQYYPDTKIIRIGIADTGVGIKRTISQSYATGKDVSAIKLALVPGVTGTTTRIGGTETNAGAGLFFIKSIAKVGRNFFMVYSGDALYKLLRTEQDRPVRLYPDPDKDKHSEKEKL